MYEERGTLSRFLGPASGQPPTPSPLALWPSLRSGPRLGAYWGWSPAVLSLAPRKLGEGLGVEMVLIIAVRAERDAYAPYEPTVGPHNAPLFLYSEFDVALVGLI